MSDLSRRGRIDHAARAALTAISSEPMPRTAAYVLAGSCRDTDFQLALRAAWGALHSPPAPLPLIVPQALFDECREHGIDVSGMQVSKLLPTR